MTSTSRNSLWLLLALPLVGAFAGGCCQAFPLPGEQHCATDARRIYCGAGEEAVRRCPCGPDRDFYGHKPTDWRTWPEGWRYGQYPCNALPADAAMIEALPPVTIAPAAPIPFKIDGATEVQPSTPGATVDEPVDIDFTPAKPTPAKNATPVQKPAAVQQPATPGPAPQDKQDLRSSADIIMQGAPAVQPAEKPPAAAPPEHAEETKGTTAKRLLPMLTSVGNEKAPREASSVVTAFPSVGKREAKAAAAGEDATSVNKRVSEHLMHTLSN